MIKLVGSLCILAGGMLICRANLAGYRRHLDTLSDLSMSLRRMGEEIRTLRRPLPELLHSLSSSCGPESADFLERIAGQAEQGEDLSAAWRHQAQTLPLSERERMAVASLGDDLRGDETQICGALELAAKMLAKSRDELEQNRQAEEKRTTALSLSAAALLVILLI